MASEIVWVRGATLGKGSFGFVSLAWLIEDEEQRFKVGAPMAVKSAPVPASNSLIKEANLLQSFGATCPHILRCHGSSVTTERGEDLYNVFLEYASNGSLADRIKACSPNGLQEAEIRRHTKSILRGLSFIHSRGYVHCDIKPDNILLMDQNNNKAKAKIADLGFAKRAGKEARKLRGTPLYVAPESVVRLEHEAPCDVWALGCTVLQMITARPPSPCDSTTKLCDLLGVIADGDSAPEIPSWGSTEAKDFLKRCFVKDPKARWSCDMLLRHPFVSSTTTRLNIGSNRSSLFSVLPTQVEEEEEGKMGECPLTGKSVCDYESVGVEEEGKERMECCSFSASFIPL